MINDINIFLTQQFQNDVLNSYENLRSHKVLDKFVP
jgi:hypothetical protein